MNLSSFLLFYFVAYNFEYCDEILFKLSKKKTGNFCGSMHCLFTLTHCMQALKKTNKISVTFFGFMKMF